MVQPETCSLPALPAPQHQDRIPSLPRYVFQDLLRRLDVAEVLGAAGYKPTEVVRMWLGAGGQRPGMVRGAAGCKMASAHAAHATVAATAGSDCCCVVHGIDTGCADNQHGCSLWAPSVVLWGG